MYQLLIEMDLKLELSDNASIPFCLLSALPLVVCLPGDTISIANIRYGLASPFFLMY
jgi:hypothetical protein